MQHRMTFPLKKKSNIAHKSGLKCINEKGSAKKKKSFRDIINKEKRNFKHDGGPPSACACMYTSVLVYCNKKQDSMYVHQHTHLCIVSTKPGKQRKTRFLASSSWQSPLKVRRKRGKGTRYTTHSSRKNAKLAKTDKPLFLVPAP